MAALVGLAAAARVQVEVVADVVCPWCYIGLARLQKALAQLPDPEQVSVQYSPFILRRHMPKEGVPKLEVFKQQFGSTQKGESILAQIASTASDEGLCFDMVGHI